MDEVARASNVDRGDIFRAAGAKLGILPRVVEKDFWVCWSLRRLFTLPAPPAGLLFKGGTSLSKVYRAINRFSEDVDLSFDRADLGFPSVEELRALPRKKRDAVLDTLTAQCRELVRRDCLDLLTRAFEQALPRGSHRWELRAGDDDGHGQTLLFRYPSVAELGGSQSYIVDMIRLEFGARSEHWPRESHDVMCYACEAMPGPFANGSVQVNVLAATRTFWEKATILHMWHHAPDSKQFRGRQSRHYHDLAMLVRHRIGAEAMSAIHLLEQVAEHKPVLFPSAWASYETARRGTLRLLPRISRRAELQRDYDAMRAEMIFADPPEFAEVMGRLEELEALVNSAPSSLT